MSLVVGSISIDPITGATISSTGAAGAAFDSLLSNTDFGTLSTTNPPAFATAKRQLGDIAEAIATAVAYVKENAELDVVVASMIPVSVSGSATAQTGATTSTGTGTGKVI